MWRMLALLCMLFFAGCDDTGVSVLSDLPVGNQEEYQKYRTTSGYAEGDVVMFIIDASGSMSGTPIEQAKKSINLFIDSLNDKVAIGMCHFDIYGSHFDGILSKESAKEVVNGLVSGGGTPLGKSLSITRDLMVGSSYKNKTIFLVTDGECNDNITLMNDIAENLPKDRIFLDVVGYNLSSAHALKKYASRYREANEATLTQVLLEKED